MTLLEIIHGKQTSDEVIKTTESVMKAMKRDIIHVTDVPGFVANRIFCMMSNEADWAVSQNEAKKHPRGGFSVKIQARFTDGFAGNHGYPWQRDDRC